MSGAQTGAIIGQVVGSYFGPIGSAVGGAIGGAIGGSFDPDILHEGPRLGDLHVQSSTYGQAIPIVYGTVRIAGNVIWSSDIRETAIDTDQGKGGPTVTQREFSYDVDAAIAICEGPIVDIERIFANGVLIFDKRVGVSPQSVYAGGLWATGMTLYVGSTTQLPDPTIEAAVGVGNTQAYRGTAYLMLTGIQLNVLKTATLPNFEFVVVQAGSVTQFDRILAVDNISPSYRTNPSGGIGSSLPLPRVLLDQGVVRIANDANAQVHLYDLAGAYQGMSPQTEFDAQRPPTLSGGIYGFWRMFDGTNATVVSSVGLLPTDLQIGANLASELIAGSPSRQFISFTQCKDNASIIGLVRDPAHPNGWADEWIRFRWTGGDDGELVIDDRGDVPFAMAIARDFGAPTAMFNHHSASFAESDLRTIWTVIGSGNGEVYVYQIDSTNTLTLLYTFTGTGESIFDYALGASVPSIYSDNGLAYIVADDSLQVYSRLSNVAQAGPTLSTVVGDLCERSGIISSERTTSALTQIVDGFVVGSTMNARGAIESLRPGYFFDAVDGDTLKFVNRGALAADTFEYDYIGAGEGEADPVFVKAQFAQETELPSRVNIRYVSRNADYQIGAQSSRRETTNSQEILDQEIPAVFTDTRAAEIADINLHDRWAGSTLRMWNSGLKYSQYEPTDVVFLDDGAYVRSVRITRRVDRGGLIEWEGRDEDAEIYTSTAAARVLSVPTQTIAAPGPTEMEPLDLPPLTELPSGNESAAYVAAKGYLSGWSGAFIEISRDDGTTFTAGTTVTTASVMGAVSTVLADFLGGNVFDEASTVRVHVGAGTLSSVTHDQIYEGANAAVIGDEIVQFRTAALVSAGVYDLSGFLRGRKGTEWAMDEHTNADRFVMLTTNLRNLPLLISDRSAVEILLRATSSGTFFGSAPVESFSPQIARLMPYSPSHLSAVRNLDASWYLTWVRRDRYMNDWNDLVDVPMSEVAELYDVEVYNVGGELLETYTDVNDEYVDIDADVLGGSPTPSEITFSVWQKSAIVGRGFEANATITQAL